VGGVIVYQYTNRSDADPRFFYSIKPPAHFNYAGEIVTANTIKIDNSLGGRLENVEVFLSYQAPIDDLKVSQGTISAYDFSAKISEDRLSATIGIPFLRSNENVSLQVFSQSGMELDPTLRVISDKYVAEQEVAAGFAQPSKSAELIDFLVIAASAFTALISATALRWGIPKLYDSVGGRRSSNDTGFVLLHLGDVDEALSIFKRAIERDGASAYEFSNLALCYAMQGNLNKAETYLRASEFLLNSTNYPIINLNRALIEFTSGDIDSAKANLCDYKKNNSRKYRHYIKFSDILKRAEAELDL